MQQFIYIFDLFGTAVFALTGVLAGTKHRMDPFGILVLASVTAVGGGTIRDMILGTTPAFWLTDLNYLWMIIGTIVVSFIFVREPDQVRLNLLSIADAFGLALFTVIGASKALLLGYSGVIACAMGTLTGVGGGMIRDVLCQRVPLVLQKEVYATASLAGGLAYSVGFALHLDQNINVMVSMLIVLAIRLAAIHWSLSLPVLTYHREATEEQS